MTMPIMPSYGPSADGKWGIQTRNHEQGPVLLFQTAYVAAGGDPASTGVIYPCGGLGSDGVEINHQLTISERDILQGTFNLDAFLTKQSFDMKFTLEQRNADMTNVFGGLTSSQLARTTGATPNTLTEGIGEPLDITDPSAVPSWRPPMRQILLLFPSPGYDFNTSPAGKWGLYQLYKGFVAAKGPVKKGLKNAVTQQITMRFLADYSITGSANRVGIRKTYDPLGT